MARLSATTVLVLVLLPVAVAARAGDLAGPKPVVLGKAHLFPRGTGWGTARPRVIFNGGLRTGRAWSLRWTDWGAATSHARGLTWLYRPDGGYYRTPGVVVLRASRPGRCAANGPRAYRYLEARTAVRPGGRLGPWFAWGGWGHICRSP